MDELKNKKIELISIVIAIISIFLPRTSFKLNNFERSFQSGSSFILQIFRHESFTEWFSYFLSNHSVQFLIFWIQYITYTIAILLLIANLVNLLKSFNQSEIMCELSIEEEQQKSRYAFTLFTISGFAFLISWLYSVISISDRLQFVSSRLSVGYFITLIASGFPVFYLKKQNYE